jgi:hypothetical protein
MVSGEDAREQLPEWLCTHLPFESPELIENWLLDIDQRQWYWWSGAVVGPFIKIDLCMEGLPNSSKELRQVVAAAGVTLIYDDLWITSEQVLALPKCARNEHGMVSIAQIAQ